MSRSAKKRRPISVRVVKALEIPPDLLPGVFHMEVLGNLEMVLQGCQGILSYDNKSVCIATAKMPVRFWGENLTIQSMTGHQFILRGPIRSIEFLD